MRTQSLHVKTLDLQPINLIEKYRGENLLVLFYNNDCLGCTGRAIPLAYQMQKEFENLRVIAIHSNFRLAVTRAEILAIFTKKELPFPIYIDEEHKAYDAFQCEGTPHWVLFNKEGIIHRSFFGSQEGAQSRMWYALTELLS